MVRLPTRGSRLLVASLLPVLLTTLSLSIHDQPVGAPLPWDMAHHTLRANRMAAALRSLDAQAIVSELRSWDVYPPATYAGVGVLQALSGSEAWAWRVAHGAMWSLLALAGLWGFIGPSVRRCVLLLLLAASNGFLLGLSAQRMLDFPAALTALLALAALARVDTTLRSGILAGCALTLALLSKANAGLPAAAVGLGLAGLALLRGERRRGLHLLIAGCAALSLWAAFTTWQDHGWQAFFAFARNRANSSEWSSFRRGGRYLDLLASWVGGWWVAAPFLLCVALGLRSRFSWAALLYAGAIWTAISIHPYFLSRNLAAPALALCVPAACGMELLTRWKWSHGGTWVLVATLFGLQILSVAVPIARAESRRQIPPALAQLSAPSRLLETWLVQNPGPTLVLGSFRELSKPWIQTLAERHRAASVTVDLYYPLEPSRSGWDARWDEGYVRVFERYRRDFECTEIIVIRSAPDSAWRSGDYRAWNAYKENYARCVERSQDFLLAERVDFEDAGIELSRFSRRFTPVEFTSGWRSAESWGRWMADEDATLLLPRILPGSSLILELAPHHQQLRPIRVRIEAAGLEPVEWDITGEPWRFQCYVIPLANMLTPDSVHLRVLDTGSDAPRDRRLLAVQTIGVVESPQHRAAR